MKIFVPFDEKLIADLPDVEVDGLGELVPYQLGYDCLRMRSQQADEREEQQEGWLEVVIG